MLTLLLAALLTLDSLQTEDERLAVYDVTKLGGR